MMKQTRPCLITIHCANPRLKLALKNAAKEIPKFTEWEKLKYNYLLKNSGNLKTEIKNASAALNLSYFTLHKIYRTRFLNHRHRGYINLLHN